MSDKPSRVVKIKYLSVIPRRRRIFRNILRNDAAGANCDVRTNRHILNYTNPGTDINVVTN